MFGRPPRSTLDRSSAASDVYKGQVAEFLGDSAAMGKFRTEMDAKVKALLDELYKGFSAMKKTGLPVECVEPQGAIYLSCLLYTSPSPRDRTRSRMPSYA